MLYEIQNSRQHEGEPTRRWFFSHEQDLYVWQEPDESITAFQLCYGKPTDERALYWRSDRGFAHLKVEEGRRDGTPLLVADGELQVARLLGEFQRLGADLPVDIRTFVEAHLLEYPAREVKPEVPPQPTLKKPWWRFW